MTMPFLESPLLESLLFDHCLGVFNGKANERDSIASGERAFEHYLLSLFFTGETRLFL